MTSIPRLGSPTSSPESPIFQLRVCMNCCLGNGSPCARTTPPISKPPDPHAISSYSSPSLARVHQSGGLRRRRTESLPYPWVHPEEGYTVDLASCEALHSARVPSGTRI